MTLSFASFVASVTFTLRNTGSVAGAEAAQVYVQDPIQPLVRPWKRLAAFEKVALAAGASTTVRLSLAFADIALHDEAMRFVVTPGSYRVSVGGSSVGDALRATAHLSC